MESGRAVITDKCVECGACVIPAAPGRLSLRKQKETGADLGQYKGVWVFVENRKKGLQMWRWSCWEKAGSGGTIGTGAGGVLIGDGVEELAKECFAHGADRVYLVGGLPLPIIQPDPIPGFAAYRKI